ncbi:MAG TPA: protein kinase [Acidobacteriota bacterium]
MTAQCPKCRFNNPADTNFCGKCGTPIPSSQDIPFSQTETFQAPVRKFVRGTTFAGRYEVIEELGQGGMGSVYRVEDKKVGEEVALKLIRPEIASDHKTIERFRNELKTARKIAHRNICRMFDLGQAEGTHFLTMEYVPGEDLKGLIRKIGQLPLAKALAIAEQICAGLAEAHRLGIIHRDLKPGNIMVDREGNARIMDFGISRALKSKGLTGSGVMVGTPEYMSPEQAEAKDVDGRSDLYALGVILYEMVTGRLPFEGETPLSVAMKHKAEKPRSPKDLNPHIPEALNRVILKCLEKDKEKRFQTAGQLSVELEAIDKGIPTGEREKPRRKPLTSKEITVTFGVKKLLVPGLAFLAIIAAAVLLWRLLPRKIGVPTQKIENSLAVISFENQSGDKAYDYLQKAIPTLLITNLEQTGYFYVATWERMLDLLKQMGKENVEVINRDMGFEVCRREGIGAIILGSYIKAGDTFVMDVKVLDVGTKRLLKSAQARGRGVDSILNTQIDELSREISRGMGIALQKIAADKIKIADVTTTSVEAYNYFLKGLESYDKYYFEDARQALLKAVDLDPQFAVAYLYLAYVYSGLRNLALQAESYKKAKALAARATEKERLYIEAAYARAVEKNPEKRYQILLDLAAKYPKEKRAHVHLASYYRDKKMVPQAIEELNKALNLDPGYGRAFELLAYVSMDRGEIGKATEYLKKYTTVSPGDADPYGVLGDICFKAGKLDEAMANYRAALKIKPNYGAEEKIAYIHAVKGEYIEAQRSIDEYILQAPSKGLQARGEMWRAYYDHVLGKRDLAMKEADRAIESWKSVNEYGVSVINMLEAWFCYDRGEYEKGRRLMQEYVDFNKSYDPQMIRMNTSLLEHYLALLDVKQGRIESAKQRLEKANLLLTKAARDSPSRMAQGGQLHKIVQAEIMLAEGKPEQAVSSMENEFALTIPGMNPPEILVHNMPFEQDVLARAYQKAGDLDKAIDEYQKLLTFDPRSNDRRLHIPVYHGRLARLYEQKGLKEKTKLEYEKFLDLWKDADPGLIELREARNKLAELKR